MIDRLKRLVPAPLVRVLKAARVNPVAGAPPRYRSQLGKNRQRAREGAAAGPPRSTARPGPASGGARPQRDLESPGKPRGSAKAPRARTRAKPAGPPSYDDELWWELRGTLAGWPAATGLTDFTYFPGKILNPYLRLLYSALPQAGYDPRPMRHLEHVNRLSPSAVLHLHWTRVAQLGATTEQDARRLTDAFLDTLAAFVERGGRLLWSVHEALPHDCPYPAIEADLRQHLTDLAAGIHVLHSSTVDAVEPHYHLDPAKVFVVEHPLYTGVYPSYIGMGPARRLLGVGDDDVLLLGFGAIRPYKGYDRLVRMLPRLRQETELPVRLVIAGPTMPSVDNSELRDLVAASQWVTMTEEPVPDEFVQVLFNGADVLVLPYRDVLNSGVLMLGLTFGNVAVAPENPVTRASVESGLLHLFDGASDEDLFAAVVRAIQDRERSHTGLPEAFAKRYDPAVVAADFAAAVARVVDA
jgi:glycosyltransferase involved in cell wall biosynthesis